MDSGPIRAPGWKPCPESDGTPKRPCPTYYWCCPARWQPGTSTQRITGGTGECHIQSLSFIMFITCLFSNSIIDIIYSILPEKGGRKPALSPNLFVSAEKCRGSGHDRSYHPKRPLTIPYEQKPKPSAAPLEDFSLLCNPSPPLPQYHFSSPCKLSCSEPQRTLLSVELRSSSTFLRFPAAFDDFSFIFFRFFSNLSPAVPLLSSVFLLRNLP